MQEERSILSTPPQPVGRVVEGLRRSGFVSRFDLEFNLRDRQNLIPHGVPFHFTPLDADYAYT